MLAKLNEVEARFEILNARLADPETSKNPRLLRDLGREHRELGKVVEAFRALKKVEVSISGNREIIAAGGDAELVAMAQEELAELNRQREEMLEALKVLLLPKDPNDDRNVLLEIRSGTGGDEACLFAGDLFRMYTRYADAKGWKVELLSVSPGAQGGYKEVIALLEGESVYSNMKFESGVHRVQRVPATEAQGRIHTSAVTVAVLPEAEEVDVDIQDKDLRIDVYRAGGKGGQGVNTTDSAVRITHLPTNLVVVCQDERSQIKNKSRAMKILRARLLEKLRSEQEAEIVAQRRSMVGSGDRSEKIRTYNYPQDRLTDHRIGFTVHNLPRLLDGDLDELVVALRTHFQAEALKNSGAAS
jgi:peptide chain release factor 1